MDETEELKKKLKKTKSEKDKILLLFKLAEMYLNRNSEISTEYADEAIKLAEKTNDQLNLSRAYNKKGKIKVIGGHLKESLTLFEKALSIQEKIQDNKLVCTSLNSIGLNHYYLGNFKGAMFNLEKAIEISREIGANEVLAPALSNRGLVLEALQEKDKALESYFECLEIEENEGVPLDKMADTLGNIGSVYESIYDNGKALEYYKKSLSMYFKTRNKKGLAGAISNVANILKDNDQEDLALKYYMKALKFAEDVKNKEFCANILNNIGLVYLRKKNHTKALEYFNGSLRINEILYDKKSTANNLNNIADVYTFIKDYGRARECLEKSCSISREIGALNLEAESLFKHAYLFARQNDFITALEYLHKADNLNDLIFSEDLSGKISELETRFEIEKKKRDEINIQTRAEFFRLKNDELNETLAELTEEKIKTDSVLKAIFPEKVRERLKQGKPTGFENFRNVTVFYSDIADFTSNARGINPESLIGELNEIFSSFDEIFEKWECERIMTIGDAYLAVSGLFDKKTPEGMVSASNECLDYLCERNKKRNFKWMIRAGIHTGNVTCGVMGKKKFLYEVTGEAVDIAKYIQSIMPPMILGISSRTFEMLSFNSKIERMGIFESEDCGQIKVYKSVKR
ncbi:tetratricopeptide repeat protein [candidate division WOR-3 bacterium]|nr:tetratricopeptide repeat protein [candidate division WOR-3 bacterium]